MSKSFKVDLTGQRFGRLTVLEFVPNNEQAHYWRCSCCVCGSKSEILKQSEITRGGKRSDKQRLKEIWHAMKRRCYDKKDKRFEIYGGRGIEVCDEWYYDFECFYEWSITHGYADNLTLDRIDSNKGYFSDNCRWVNIATQEKNRRNTIFVEYKGEKMCLLDASRKSGISYATLFVRHKKGLRGKELFKE